MTKRFALVLVVLLVAPMLLTACEEESSNTAKDYYEAVLKGEKDEALKYVCEDDADMQAYTESLIALYEAQEVDGDELDLQYDIGKAMNTEEVIITGSYGYGAKDDELELVAAIRASQVEDMIDKLDLKAATDDAGEPYFLNDKGEFERDEMVETRVILWLEEQDGDWCVTSKSEFGDIVEAAIGTLEGAAPDAADDSSDS
jgi:hypothetical protein